LGQDSPNRIACEIIKRPKVAMNKMVRINVMIMAMTLFIFFFTKKQTTGCRTIEIIIENMNGMIIPFAMYSIEMRAYVPMKKRDAFAKNGNINGLSMLSLISCLSIFVFIHLQHYFLK
jgi:hypothetical protein